MRIATPCTEDLDRAARTPDGSFCAKCEKNVVDLRRVPRKRALAIISTLRAEGDGQVCVRVRATRDGVPVFHSEPSRLARFAMPIALASSLAACAPSSASTSQRTTPVAIVADHRASNENPPPVRPRPATETTATPDTINVAHPPDGVEEMAGGLAFTETP